jgi:hypothetical protein
MGEPTPGVMEPLLAGVLDDTFRDLREASARALGRMATRMPPAARREATRALVRAVHRYDPGRDVLAYQLKFFPGKRAVEALIEHLGSRERDVSNACWEALKAVTGEAVPQDVEQWRSWWQLARSQPRWREEPAVEMETGDEGPEARPSVEAGAAPPLELPATTELPPPPEEPFLP